MKVPTIGPSGPAATQRIRRTDSAGGARFLDHLDKASDGETEAAAPVAGVAALSVVLAAQEVDEDGERSRRQQLVQRGEDILDRLEEIRRDIISGVVPKARLESLAQMLRSRRATASDPRLIQILDEVELRAAVEIAKLTR